MVLKFRRLLAKLWLTALMCFILSYEPHCYRQRAGNRLAAGWGGSGLVVRIILPVSTSKNISSAQLIDFTEIPEKLCLNNFLAFQYAGLEASNECHCGNTYDHYGKVDDSSCNRPCKGNTTQMCGGNMVLSVFYVWVFWFTAVHCTTWKVKMYMK